MHGHIEDMGDLYCMKKIGFLSFGHWTPSPRSHTQSATDALLQSIDLAVEAERLGMDGAYFRVHHFAQQLVRSGSSRSGFRKFWATERTFRNSPSLARSRLFFCSCYSF